MKVIADYILSTLECSTATQTLMPCDSVNLFLLKGQQVVHILACAVGNSVLFKCAVTGGTDQERTFKNGPCG